MKLKISGFRGMGMEAVRKITIKDFPALLLRMIKGMISSKIYRPFCHGYLF
jgi:tartrate dehydratase beta subunit/fumarate hydratase class I family protein